MGVRKMKSKTVKTPPKMPKLYLCENCKMFFFSTSQLEKPTHPKCFGHRTRLATNQEIDEINRINKTHFNYNRIEVKE